MSGYNFRDFPEAVPEFCGWYLCWDGDALPRTLNWDGEHWIDDQFRIVDTVSHWDFIPERPHGA